MKFWRAKVRLLILGILIVFGFATYSFSKGYDCNPEIFSYDRFDVRKWKGSLPLMGQGLQFPIVLYWTKDPLGICVNCTSHESLGRYPYVGYVTIDSFWNATFTPVPNGKSYEYNDFIYGLDAFIEKYNNQRPKNKNFIQSKEFLEKYFLDQGDDITNFFILGADGEDPDPGFIPLFNPEIDKCSRQAGIKRMMLHIRNYDKDFSAYRPVNLKPGMRVLVPEPPQDSDEPRMREDGDADVQ